MKPHKVIAKELRIHIATAYRQFPVPKRTATQADAMLLQLQGHSIRQIAQLLDIPRSTVWRLLQ